MASRRDGGWLASTTRRGRSGGEKVHTQWLVWWLWVCGAVSRVSCVLRVGAGGRCAHLCGRHAGGIGASRRRRRRRCVEGSGRAQALVSAEGLGTTSRMATQAPRSTAPSPEKRNGSYKRPRASCRWCWWSKTRQPPGGGRTTVVEKIITA